MTLSNSCGGQYYLNLVTLSSGTNCLALCEDGSAPSNLTSNFTTLATIPHYQAKTRAAKQVNPYTNQEEDDDYKEEYFPDGIGNSQKLGSNEYVYVNLVGTGELSPHGDYWKWPFDPSIDYRNWYASSNEPYLVTNPQSINEYAVVDNNMAFHASSTIASSEEIVGCLCERYSQKNCQYEYDLSHSGNQNWDGIAYIFLVLLVLACLAVCCVAYCFGKMYACLVKKTTGTPINANVQPQGIANVQFPPQQELVLVAFVPVVQAAVVDSEYVRKVSVGKVG